MVWEDASNSGVPKNRPAPANFRDWNEQNQSFIGMAALRATFANVAGEGPPEQLSGQAVSASLFPLLGVSPMLGPHV